MTSTPDCGNAYSANFKDVKVGKYNPTVLLAFTDGSNATVDVGEITVKKTCNIFEL